MTLDAEEAPPRRNDAPAAPRLLLVTTVPVTLKAFLLPLARRFREKGWRVDALARGAAEDPSLLEHFDRVWSAEWSRNPLDPSNLVGTPARLRALVRREDYDLVHVHTPVASFVTRYALRGLDGPRVIYTAHGFHFHPSGAAATNAAYLSLEKLASRWTGDLVVMNEEDAEAARRHGLVPEDRLWPMPGIGVDLDHYSPHAVAPGAVQRARKELLVDEDAPMLTMTAEFIARKRHADALRAFARLDAPRAVLALTSDGPLRRATEDLARRLGIASRVRFVGLVPDLRPLVVASACTLLPSRQEGLPRSVMESMALGTPVIASRIRGTRELLRGRSERLLVDVGDVEGLARAMRWVLDHPADAKAAAEEARERMRAYDLRTVLGLHEELYATALKR